MERPLNLWLSVHSHSPIRITTLSPIGALARRVLPESEGCRPMMMTLNRILKWDARAGVVLMASAAIAQGGAINATGVRTYGGIGRRSSI